MSSARPPLSLRRVVRAFVQALRMTARGEVYKSAAERAAERHPALTGWMDTTRDLIDGITGAGGADLEALKVTVEKRTMTARILLDSIRYHAAAEFPYLLTHENQYTLIGMQAINLNDRFLVLQLVNLPTLPDSLKAAVAALRDHLDAMPTDAASS